MPKGFVVVTKHILLIVTGDFPFSHIISSVTIDPPVEKIITKQVSKVSSPRSSLTTDFNFFTFPASSPKKDATFQDTMTLGGMGSHCIKHRG